MLDGSEGVDVRGFYGDLCRGRCGAAVVRRGQKQKAPPADVAGGA